MLEENHYPETNEGLIGERRSAPCRGGKLVKEKKEILKISLP